MKFGQGEEEFSPQTGHGESVILKVFFPDGREVSLTRWLSVSIDKSIESLAGSAVLTLSYGHGIPWSSVLNYKAQVLLYSKKMKPTPIITGYISSIRRAWTESEHAMEVTIVDWTQDLVECNPITDILGDPTKGYTPSVWKPPVDQFSLLKPQILPSPSYLIVKADTRLTPPTFENSSLADICMGLCAPFGVRVIDNSQIDPGTDVELGGKFEKVEIEESETVASKIVKLCQERGVVPYTNGEGDLVLGQFVFEYTYSTMWNKNNAEQNFNNPTQERRIGQHQAEYFGDVLTRRDILEMRQTCDGSRRFSYYRCRYFEGTPGEQRDSETTYMYTVAKDEAILRWRPVVMDIEEDYRGNREQYPEYIKTLERGRSVTHEITLRRWSKTRNDEEGRSSYIDAYRIGDRVTIDAWDVKVSGIIVSTKYSLEGDGFRKLDINVISEAAFVPQWDDNTHIITDYNKHEEWDDNAAVIRGDYYTSGGGGSVPYANASGVRKSIEAQESKSKTGPLDAIIKAEEYRRYGAGAK